MGKTDNYHRGLRRFVASCLLCGLACLPTLAHNREADFLRGGGETKPHS